MKRFLQYSLEHERRIKVVIWEDNKLTQMNLTVVAMDDETFTYVSSRQKKPRTLPLGDLMAAAYARGDSGENE